VIYPDSEIAALWCKHGEEIKGPGHVLVCKSLVKYAVFHADIAIWVRELASF
jgi:hypothetical protein